MTSCEAVGLLSREGPVPPSWGSSGVGGSLPTDLEATWESAGRVGQDPACRVSTFSTLNSPPKSQARRSSHDIPGHMSPDSGPALASPFLSACGQAW